MWVSKNPFWRSWRSVGLEQDYLKYRSLKVASCGFFLTLSNPRQALGDSSAGWTDLPGSLAAPGLGLVCAELCCSSLSARTHTGTHVFPAWLLLAHPPFLPNSPSSAFLPPTCSSFSLFAGQVCLWQAGALPFPWEEVWIPAEPLPHLSLPHQTSSGRFSDLF